MPPHSPQVVAKPPRGVLRLEEQPGCIRAMGFESKPGTPPDCLNCPLERESGLAQAGRPGFEDVVEIHAGFRATKQTRIWACVRSALW